MRNDRLKIRHKGYAIEGARDFNTRLVWRLVRPELSNVTSDGSSRSKDRCEAVSLTRLLGNGGNG